MAPPIIVIDSREQCPLPVSGPTERDGLLSGDYSVRGCEHRLAIERKGLDDLASSVTHGRERFERELHRLRGFDFARLLIVGTEDAVRRGAYRSRANPKAVLHTLAAFEARYIPVVYSPTPQTAAALVEKWCHWYHREICKAAQAIGAGVE